MSKDPNRLDLDPPYQMRHWAFMIEWWSGVILPHVRDEARRNQAIFNLGWWQSRANTPDADVRASV